MMKKIMAISFIFVCTSIGWIILAGTVALRTDQTTDQLKSSVNQLWGVPQLQREPRVYYINGNTLDLESYPIEFKASDIDVNIGLEHRKKGLIWYSTYKVDFDGTYKITNPDQKQRDLAVNFTLPAKGASYDKFEVYLDQQKLENFDTSSGTVTVQFPAKPDQVYEVQFKYSSQGMERWDYDFGQNVKQVKDFSLTVTTDFDNIDFPEEAVSPTEKQKTSNGWQLTWKYENRLTGIKIGIAMPEKQNPGPWVSRLTTMAPVSLFLYFFLLFIITSIKKIDLHPMNYFFIGTSFFSFHLLMAYLVDHISIHLAFWICSAVSLFLVISYMRLVVGLRFAFVEIAISQLVYLIFFSYTFFLKGYTGLAITILCICTLFTVMQATGRMDWNEAFKKIDPVKEE